MTPTCPICEDPRQGRFCARCGDPAQYFRCDGGHWSGHGDGAHCSRCGLRRPATPGLVPSPGPESYTNNAVYGGDVTGGSKYVVYGTMTQATPTQVEGDFRGKGLDRHPTGMVHDPGSHQNLGSAVIAGSVAGRDLTVNHGTLTNHHTHVYRDDTRQTVPCGVCEQNVPVSNTLRPCPQCERAVCTRCNGHRNQMERHTGKCLSCGKRTYLQVLEQVYADNLLDRAELIRLRQIQQAWVIPEVLAEGWRRGFEGIDAADPSVLELNRFDEDEIERADAFLQSGDPDSAIARLKPILDRFQVPPPALLGHYLSALIQQNPCSAEHEIPILERKYAQEADDLAMEFLAARHECWLLLDGHDGAQRAITEAERSRFSKHPRILLRKLEARLDAWNTDSTRGSTLNLIEDEIRDLRRRLADAVQQGNATGRETLFLETYLAFSQSGRVPDIADPSSRNRIVRKAEWLRGGELLVSVEHRGQKGTPLRWPDGGVLGRDPGKCPRQMLYRLLRPHSTTPESGINASMGCHRPRDCRCVFCLVASEFGHISREHFMMRRKAGTWCLSLHNAGANGRPALDSIPAEPGRNTPVRPGPSQLRLHGLSATLTVRPFPRYPLQPQNGDPQRNPDPRS